MDYELKQYSFGETLGKAFNLYFNNFITVTLISLLCQVPVVLLLKLTNLMDITQYGDDYILLLERFGIVLAMGIIMEGILTAIIIHFIAKKFLEGGSAGPDNQGSVLPYILPIIGLSIIVGVVIILGSIVIVPGIILALGYSLATVVLIVEKRKIFNSMKRSRDLTKGKKGTILGLWFVIWIIVVCVNQVILLVIKQFVVDVELMLYLNFAVEAITDPLQSCLLVVIYFNIRIEKEGFNIEHLARQFTLAEPPPENSIDI